ncbi:MAG TPA: hypothetical protein VFM56_12690 [Solimonas sp.]|nr:hypothetical protein [Solimonas sp.]
MKRALATLAGIAIPFAVYWLGGGDFVRDPALGFTAIVAIPFGAMGAVLGASL